MKKIIYMPIPMQPELKALYNLSDEIIKEKKLDDFGKIYFPINAYIADYLYSEDEIKVCFIELTDDKMRNELEARYKENEKLFKNEIEKIGKLFNAKIEYTTVETVFNESVDIFGNRFEELYKCLEKNCEIYADITFGAKTNTLIINNVLTFAELFYDCNVEAIVYGKTIFEKNDSGKTVPNQEVAKVCDVTSLYYLTKLTSQIKASSPEEAIAKVKKYLKI